MSEMPDILRRWFCISSDLLVGLRKRRLNPMETSKSSSPNKKKTQRILSMALNCIYWWDSSFVDLGSVGYPFLEITSRSTLAKTASICKSSVSRSNKSVCRNHKSVQTSTLKNNYWLLKSFLRPIKARPAGSVEYIEYISAEGKDSPQRVSWYDTKQSNGQAPVILEIWGMWCTPLLPSLPGSHWPGLVALDRVLCMGQIELFDLKTVYSDV